MANYTYLGRNVYVEKKGTRRCPLLHQPRAQVTFETCAICCFKGKVELSGFQYETEEHWDHGHPYPGDKYYKEAFHTCNFEII